MSFSEERIRSFQSRIEQKDARIHRQSMDDHRTQYVKQKQTEIMLGETLQRERARCKNQERELEKKGKELDDSRELIQRLQADLEAAKRAADSARWELRESELRSANDAAVFQYKSTISGLEARLQRKQAEIDGIAERAHQTEESMQKEINELREALESTNEELQKLRDELAAGRKNIDEKGREDREYIDGLQQKVGEFKARHETLVADTEKLRAEKGVLEVDLKFANDEIASLRRQMDSMRRKAEDEEGNNFRTNQYLVEEHEKIKLQKAEMRCEFIRLKREHQELLEKHQAATGPTAKEAELEKQVKDLEDQLQTMSVESSRLKTENSSLRLRAESLEWTVSDYRFKLAAAERTVKESEDCNSARVDQLTSELCASRDKLNSMQMAMDKLDSQCDLLVSTLKTAEDAKRRVINDCARMELELEGYRKESLTQLKEHEELSTLREENSRLTDKVEYLESELRESHTDYREELAKLARQVTEARTKSAETPQSTQLTAKIHQLESEMRQKESLNRCLERQVEQAKQEGASLKKETADLQKRQCELVNENTTLRQALADAIKKMEDYRVRVEEQRSENVLLSSQTSKLTEKTNDLEDLVQELRTELNQQKKLAGYLESQVQTQPKQSQKTKSVCYQPALVENGFFPSTEIVTEEIKQCEKLEEQRNRLRSDLERQKQILAEKQNEAVPLLKDSHQTPRTPKSPKSATPRTPNSASRSEHVGIMRHEIPHRWRKQFITLTAYKCSVCLEGLPRFRFAHKCRECNVITHPQCLRNVVNTCGLPAQCADYYMDLHNIPLGHMTGWVKLWRSDDKAGNKWRSSWAVNSDNCLSFYDSDSLAANDGTPFLRIDLDQDRWRIYNQSGQLQGIAQGDVPMVIEIKLPSCILYMLAPTVQAKQRWVKALQDATNRRMSLHRKPSSVGMAPTLLLALERPQNLTIHCTQIIDGWMLIGAEEGMFATKASSPQVPLHLPGVPPIFHMEFVKECDMVIAICGQLRQLVAFHVEVLRRVLSGSQADAQYTAIANIDSCHIAVVSKPEHSRARYIYVATVDAIHVLQFVEKLGIFSPMHRIPTAEPCMCLASITNGFVFGADIFYYVDLTSSAVRAMPFNVDNCPSDFPVAVVEISADEVLVVFHNYGVFTSRNGRRTRRDNVEWDRVPLEFVYTEPYLYIVYCEFLEIFRVAPYQGFDSPALLEESNMFKCRSAHHTGFGSKPTDVIFAVSAEHRVELNVFNAVDAGSRKGSLKRKGLENINLASMKKKF